MYNKRIITIAATAALSLGLTACGANDAKINSRDRSGAEIHNFPNHFSSVAEKCDGHGHRVFLVDHGSSDKGGGGLAVISDPSCPGGSR